MTKDKMKHNCSNCSAFGKHCPHKVNSDPYHYDCVMTVEELEKENAELKEELKKWKDEWQEQVQKATDEGYARTLQTIQLTKAKELLKQFLDAKNGEDTYKAERKKILQSSDVIINLEV